MKSLISFFTRIPAEGDVEKAAEEAYLLPLIGALIAIPASVSFYLVNLYAEAKISALVSLAVIYFFTGLIHIDALADFADGIYARSLKAMKDVNTGVAGTFAVSFILIGTLYVLSNFNPKSFYEALTFFLAAEVGAKMTMVTMLAFSKPLGNGLGRIFIERMTRKKFLFSLLLSLALAQNIFVLLSLPIGFVVKNISEKIFGGVNGDCIGASNEISRLVIMVAILVAGDVQCYL